MMEIDVIIGCEESGTVAEEFRKIGFNAWSCDILPTSGNLPEFHIQSDIFKVIKMHPEIRLGIFFPPCTHLTISGARHFGQKRKDGRQKQAIDFFMALVNSDIEHIGTENPIGIMSSIYRKPDQIIQPWQFGHPESKATCLWLKNLPPLIETDNVYQQMKSLSKKEANRIHYMPPGPERAKLRSKTYSGIAQAMAEQWSKVLTGEYQPPKKYIQMDMFSETI